MDLKSLKDRIYNDIVTNFKNAITPLKKSLFDTLSYALASAFKLLYIYLDQIQADSFLTTCTESRVLNYFAPLKNLTLKEATSSEGIVRFTGIDTSIIPIDTIIIYNEYEYITTESGEISGGFVDINCESVEKGTLYNTINNIDLVLAFPIIGVDNEASSTPGFTGAIDDETIESLRTRTKIKFASPSKIDNSSSYKSLALEVDNVKAAFVSELKNGVGTTGITILTFSNDGVPVQADIDTVEQYFIDNEAIPTYSEFEFFLPDIISQDFTIQLIINDETNQNIIEQLIRDYLYLFVKPNKDFLYSDLNKILQANGARLENPTPSTIESLNDDQIIDVGTITWQ